jgi:hypothetical protein
VGWSGGAENDRGLRWGSDGRRRRSAGGLVPDDFLDVRPRELLLAERSLDRYRGIRFLDDPSFEHVAVDQNDSVGMDSRGRRHD